MTSNKRISCLTLAAVLSWASSAQETTPRILQFTPNVIEIGTVRYDGGPVTVTFEGENICSKPVTILDVRAALALGQTPQIPTVRRAEGGYRVDA